MRNKCAKKYKKKIIWRGPDISIDSIIYGSFKCIKHKKNKKKIHKRIPFERSSVIKSFLLIDHIYVRTISIPIEVSIYKKPVLYRQKSCANSCITLPFMLTTVLFEQKHLPESMCLFLIKKSGVMCYFIVVWYFWMQFNGSKIHWIAHKKDVMAIQNENNK